MLGGTTVEFITIIRDFKVYNVIIIHGNNAIGFNLECRYMGVKSCYILFLSYRTNRTGFQYCKQYYNSILVCTSYKHTIFSKTIVLVFCKLRYTSKVTTYLTFVTMILTLKCVRIVCLTDNIFVTNVKIAYTKRRLEKNIIIIIAVHRILISLSSPLNVCRTEIINNVGPRKRPRNT